MVLDVPVPLTVGVPWVAGVLMLQVRVSLFQSQACSIKAKGIGEPSSDIVSACELPSTISGRGSSWPYNGCPQQAGT